MTREDDRYTRLEQMVNEALAEKVHEKYPGPGSTVGQYYQWKDSLTYRLKEKAMTDYMVSSQVALDYAKITIGRLERYAKTFIEKDEIHRRFCDFTDNSQGIREGVAPAKIFPFRISGNSLAIDVADETLFAPVMISFPEEKASTVISGCTSKRTMAPGNCSGS